MLSIVEVFFYALKFFFIYVVLQGKMDVQRGESNFQITLLLGAGANLESWVGHIHVLDSLSIRKTRNGHINYILILKYL